VEGCCENGDEPTGSGATELVYVLFINVIYLFCCRVTWGDLDPVGP
jgi:hypothetical protein